jgi:hypothetical protein
MFSFANGGTRRIAVDLDPEYDFNFEEIRKLIVECVSRHPEVMQQYFENNTSPATVAAKLGRTATCGELFDVLGTPRPENALDSLT